MMSPLALAVLLVASAAACGAPLQALRVRPAVRARSSEIAVRVGRVRLSPEVAGFGLANATRLAVEMTVRNRGDRPYRFALDEASLGLQRTTGSRHDETISAVAGGPGRAPRLLRDGDWTPLPDLAPGEATSLWIAFGGFEEDDAGRRLLATVTLGGPSPVPIVIADPAGEPDRWESREIQIGFAFRQAFQVVLSDPTLFSMSALQPALVWRSGPLRMDLGLGFGLLGARNRGAEVGWFTGLHAGWPLRVTDAFSVTPTVGIDFLSPLANDTRYGNARLGGSVGVHVGADAGSRSGALGPFPIVRSRRIFAGGWTVAYVRWSPDPVKRGENGLLVLWDLGW